jgi:hypothetical protein
LLFFLGSEKSHLSSHLHGYNQAGTLHWGSCNKGSWSKPTGTTDMFPVGEGETNLVAAPELSSWDLWHQNQQCNIRELDWNRAEQQEALGWWSPCSKQNCLVISEWKTEMARYLTWWVMEHGICCCSKTCW